MEKKPFVTKSQVEEIVKTYPTPFHLYDEKGIRENPERLTCVCCVYVSVNLCLFVNHHYQILRLFPECTRVVDFQSLHTVVPGFQRV